ARSTRPHLVMGAPKVTKSHGKHEHAAGRSENERAMRCADETTGNRGNSGTMCPGQPLVRRNAAQLATPPRVRRRAVRIWDAEQLALFLGAAKRHAVEPRPPSREHISVLYAR